MQIEPIIRALADPTRLRVMRLLARMELAVGELAQVLGQSQPRVSRHIRILCDAGLAERRREGSWVFVRGVACPGNKGNEIVGALLETAEEEDAGFGAACSADRNRLAVIRAAREAHAATYFAAHAGRWDELRSLHSDDAAVESALSGLLDGGLLGSVLDIGTGTGRIAELFAGRADHVTGLDKSPDMLRLARARLQDLPAGSFDLVQGDFTALPFADGAFDTVLFHQVLHYAPAPEAALAEAARVTRGGGRIAIADFAPHDREELRSVHAHARLGFSDAQMHQWLRDTGFRPDAVRSLPGSELTVTIWTGTRRGDAIARIDPAPGKRVAKAAR